MKTFHTKELTCFSAVYENLRLETHPRAIILHDGSRLYEEQSKLLNRYTFFDYYENQYRHTFINDESIPHLICTACGSFPHLDNVVYDLDTVEYLNSRGLHIYLYETIFIDSGKKRDSLNIVDTLNPYDTIKNSLVGFESTEDNLNMLYCFDFEKIQSFATRNNLKNITVFSGDYNVNRYFKKIYPTLKFSTQDIYITSLFKETSSSFNSYEYLKNAEIDSGPIQYKFWCGTRRYEGYRHLTLSYLLDRSALCSYQYKIEDSPFNAFDKDPNRQEPLWGDLQNYLWFDLKAWKKIYPEKYNRIVLNAEYIKKTKSKSIDRDIEDSISLESHSVPYEYYEKCFCAVVTEARYAQPTGNFSEKTLNAIKCLRPFILVAPPYTLEYLKSYGVKTFSDYWDEGYDQEENHEKRLLKIFDLIDYIDSFTVTDLKILYNSMSPILEHNHKIIAQIYKEKWHD